MKALLLALFLTLAGCGSEPDNTPAPTTGGGQSGHEREEDHDHDGTSRAWTLEDLQAAGERAVARAKRDRDPLPLLALKTWNAGEDVAVKLTLELPEGETARYFTCHLHGEVMACHKATTAPAGEPADPVDPE